MKTANRAAVGVGWLVIAAVAWQVARMGAIAVGNRIRR